VRIALVNPPPCSWDEPEYDLPRFTRLSLACLAAWLRANGYRDLLLIDAKFERLGYAEVRRRLEAFDPDIVGHTAFTNEIIQAHNVAMLVREISRVRGKPILNVIGGVHVSAIPADTLREFSHFDIGAVGEGENTLLELVRWHDGRMPGSCLRDIPGLVFRDPERGDEPIVTAPRQNIRDQTQLPMPAWDLLPPSPEYLIMTARGCPFACNFCMNPNGQIVRKRDVAQVIAELKWVTEERGGEHVVICDEIMTIDKKRAHQLLDGMIGLGFGTKYHFKAETHVSCVDEDLMEKLAKAGVTVLGMGIETGDPETLRAMGKQTNLDKIRRAVAIARKSGVGVLSFFILGHPNETLRSAWNSVRFAVRINPSIPVFGIMVPYPGTAVWKWAKRGEKGYRLKARDWNDYNKQIGHAVELEHLSRRQLELLQFVGYLCVYVLNGRLRDLVRFLWTYRGPGIALIRKILVGKTARQPSKTLRERLEFAALEGVSPPAQERDRVVEPLRGRAPGALPVAQPVPLAPQ